MIKIDRVVGNLWFQRILGCLITVGIILFGNYIRI